jgi:hypothetical protein
MGKMGLVQPSVCSLPVSHASMSFKHASSARALLLSLFCLLTACSSHDPGANPTTPKYQINNEALQNKPLKKLVIATANISGEPTRYHLQAGAKHVDELVKKYLQAHDYQIAPSYQFENAWNQAMRTYGDMYDPTTGKVDASTWKAVMMTTMKTLHDTSDIDAIVFTDVVSLNSAHDVGMDHLAQWDGVRRKVSYSGTNEGLPADFNWGQTVEVSSLVITVFSTEMVGLFTGRGGLETLQEVNTKDRANFIRRKHILENDDYIEEGIELAFHPFIKMKNYPGDQK